MKHIIFQYCHLNLKRNRLSYLDVAVLNIGMPEIVIKNRIACNSPINHKQSDTHN